MKICYCIILLVLLTACGPESGNKNTKGVDSPSRLEEKHFVELGGERQYVEILSASRDNPILLFIHGGPAWPQTPQLRYYSSELSNDYTMVIWEQRGAGQNYEINPEPDNLTLEQIVQDGHELTQWLKDRFNGRAIYLAGYSWGSLVGVLLADRYPSDYKAYIGISQLANKDRAQIISQNWLREQARDEPVLMQRIDSLSHPEFYANTQEQFFAQYLLIYSLGGAVYDKESEKETEKAMAMYKDYRNYDWMGVWSKSSLALQKDLNEFDVFEVTSLDIPVFLIQGRHDWNVPSVLAEEWLDQVRAPKKKIYWFEQSGHGPLEEEAGKFNQTMLEILKETAHQSE